MVDRLGPASYPVRFRTICSQRKPNHRILSAAAGCVLRPLHAANAKGYGSTLTNVLTVVETRTGIRCFAEQVPVKAFATKRDTD
jgi:hypothetical protein